MKNKCIFKILYNLYKEIKDLKKRNQELFCKNWDLNYYVSCVKTNYEGARGALESILKNSSSDNAKYYAKIGLMYMDMRKDTIYKGNIESEVK